MSSQRTYYRRLRKARINECTPALQHASEPYRRSSKLWPSQIVKRNERFIPEFFSSSHLNVNKQNNEALVEAALPPAAYVDMEDQDRQEPEIHANVLHLQLLHSQPDGLPDTSTPAVVSSAGTPAGQTSQINSQIALFETSHGTPAALGKALVSNYINSLDIPEGLYKLWSIFRAHHAPNNMMGAVLHWFREEQLELATSISHEGIPPNLKLPLDYRGAQNELQLSSVFHVDVFCFCLECKRWKSRSMFHTPFKIPCCLRLPNDYDDHFVVNQVHEILQLLLPYYKQRVRPGFFNGCTRLEEMRQQVDGTEDDVYISIGYDGVPFSPSSGISVYPVLATIDGLSGRHTKASTFILAMWMGSLTTSKPDVRTIFRPIVEQLKTLADTPMTWIDSGGQTRKSRVFLSTILTDTVARPQVMGLTQFNGLYGCAWCLHERTDKVKWDYLEPRSQAPARTNKDLRERLGILFDEMGEPVSADLGQKAQGIQGRTPFADLPYFDIIQDFPPCTMHANYEGTAKRLLQLWMTPSRNFLTNSDIAAINEFLVSCKPPNRITRPPRQLHKLKKAHEFLVWLFYAGPVVMQDRLSPSLYYHFLSLVRGLSLLHKEAPTSADISEAHNELTDFLHSYEEHYGSSNAHYNIHILLHLCDFVKARGPLYRYSLMPMESYNKHIKELPTGPKYVTRQMCMRFLEETVFRARFQLKKEIETQPQFKGEGQHSVRDCQDAMTKAHLTFTYGENSSYFERLKLGSRVFQSLSYSAVTTTNSSCYRVGDGIFFECHVFVRTRSGYEAIGKEYRGHMFNGIFYLFTCTESPTFSAVNAAALGSVGFKMEYDGLVYIAEFLNDFEAYAE